MSSPQRIVFHDLSPPRPGGVRKDLELAALLDAHPKCHRPHMTTTSDTDSGRACHIDVETSLSTEELQRHIADHFDFAGSIWINDEIKIVRDKEHQEDPHGNARRLVATG